MDIPKIKSEMVDFLRNNDVFTITQRGVTTTTQEETLSAETNSCLSQNTPLISLKTLAFKVLGRYLTFIVSSLTI